MEKKKAHIFHQVHWDNEWYFTEEDTIVSFSFNMRELLDGLDNNRVDKFLMDGKTDNLKDFLDVNPEEYERVTKYIKEGRLIVGPFHSQLDCMISSGEAIYANLRIGHQLAKKWGAMGTTAYLPDSFGHNQDFPKIFNDFGINDFCFRRGLGDEYNLPIDFYWSSNDGSKVLCNVLQCGYGFATGAFVEGNMVDDSGEDYEGKSLLGQFRKLNDWSTLNNEFLLPIGFDLNPAILDFSEKVAKYNEESKEFDFYETTLDEYMEYLRINGVDIPTYEGELMSAQYHRIHRSLFSARTDIKVMQDEIERLLTYEVQPLATMLDRLGVPYQTGCINRAWDLCIRSQTHSSATNTDSTNEGIKSRTMRSLNSAIASKIYLVRKITESLEMNTEKSPLVVFNTLPETRDYNYKFVVYNKTKEFKLMLDGKELDYLILDQEEAFTGTIRKDKSLMDKNAYYWKTTISLNIKDMPAMSYKVINVLNNTKPSNLLTNKENVNVIENDKYKVEIKDGKVNITDKSLGLTINDAIYIEGSGDQGDNYDFDYPDKDKDLIQTSDFKDAKVTYSCQNDNYGRLTINGNFKVPYNLEEREQKKVTTDIPYEIVITLKANEDLIDFKGWFDNKALNHRIRMVLRTENKSKYAYPGSQYGIIERETYPSTYKIWKERDWLEEPTPIEPLINHVTLKGKNYNATMFTRSVKEYEIIGEGYKDIAFTIFRACGYLGLPDLNRRPGRASGLKEKLYPSPLSQVQFKNEFQFAINLSKEFDANYIGREYVNYSVNQAYFQYQRLERAVFPMSFLDTDPVEGGVPESYSMFELKDSEAVFGTMHKTEDGNDLIRIFNNSNKDCKAGKLEINVDYKSLEICNALGEKILDATTDLGHLRPGQILNIKINY